MLELWAPFAVFGCFIALLVLVVELRTRNTIRWAGETMDTSTRKVTGLALLPGVAVAVVNIAAGIHPPHGVGLGLVCGLGSFIALLGAFTREGALLKRESVAAARIAAPATDLNVREVSTFTPDQIALGGEAKGVRIASIVRPGKLKHDPQRL